MKKKWTVKEAMNVAKELGVDFEEEDFTLEDFKIGMDVELEHGKIHEITNVTDDDPVKTGMIALAHLNEVSDYYQKLLKSVDPPKKG